jgi:hypothetical protein
VHASHASQILPSKVSAVNPLLPVDGMLTIFQRKAKRAATVFNTLIDRVSRDAEYLQNTLALAADHDEFTVGTWERKLGG